MDIKEIIYRDYSLRTNAKIKLLLSLEEQYKHYDEVAFGDLRSAKEIEEENSILLEKLLGMLSDILPEYDDWDEIE